MDNIHNVPTKQWKKWNETSRKLFNSLYTTFAENQKIITHPETQEIPEIEWNTVAWNAAWLAADACNAD